MHKLEKQNRLNCSKLLDNIPYNVSEVLGYEVFDNGIEQHRILYAGISYIKRKQAILLYTLVFIFAIFINNLILSTTRIALGAVTLIITIELLVRLLINNRRYYIFVLDDTIALIPFSNPSNYIKLPNESIESISVKWPFLSMGQIKISANNNVPIDNSNKIVFDNTLGIKRGILNKYSGMTKNIRYALLTSSYSDKIKT